MQSCNIKHFIYIHSCLSCTHDQIPNAVIPCISPLSHKTHYRHLQAALADGDLDSGSIDPAKSCSLAVGQLVHGRLGKVEAGGGVINGKDVDGPASVGELPAGTALRVTR